MRSIPILAVAFSLFACATAELAAEPGVVQVEPAPQPPPSPAGRGEVAAEPDPDPPSEATPDRPAPGDAEEPPPEAHEADPPAFAPCDEGAYRAAGEAMAAAVSAQRVPGAALAIVCGGRLAFAEGFGVTATGGAEVTADTRFQWASVTKMFTAALASRLEGAGALDLDAPIATWLPGAAWGHVTLHQLLTHTAGFPTDFARSDADLQTVVRSNAQMPLWSPPGAVWNYSNPGYAVAGAALERAAGRPFAELVEAEVFAPAGMSRATMSATRVMAEPYALGHEGEPGAARVVTADGSYLHTTYYGPMGGAWGSVVDLARWGEAHLANDAASLSAAAWESLRTAHTPTGAPGQAYGYGLFLDDGLEPRVVHHGGGAPGYIADWTLVPEAGVGVFVLSNADWFDPGDVVWEVLERLVPFEFAGGAPEAPEATWPQLEGRYTDPHELGEIRVFRDGGALMAEFVREGFARELQPAWGNTYSVDHPAAEGWGMDLTFWRDDPAGPAEYIVTLWGVAARGP